MLKNKIVAVGLASVLAMPFGLVACGNKPADSSQAASSSSAAASSSSTTQDTKDAAQANEVLYWQGTLSDGRSVIYTEDEKEQTAVLAIAKEDGSEGEAWYGKYTSADDKFTITDSTTNEAVVLTVKDFTDDFSGLKINIDGIGDVDMKPITQGEFNKELEAASAEIANELEAAGAAIADELSKATLYWEGTLSDGSTVDYMDAGEDLKSLTITKTDGSDPEVWSGKATTEGTKVTITDEETKKTISYTTESGADQSSSLKINIDGYGEVELKPVTGGEFVNEVEQAVDQAVDQATQSSSAE